ncbi:STAS domain-containing protein [Spartinivicinus poritis]|uniref:STAS domain-containing protein n=1 Tax=Spartinivicinus poritis TaxID=2994640 RepID=A0ABT5U2L6_9GAMM|nr:STAS domain-containing protein [Spartinivicinus sp. A2-2]MDE1460612.1 STAS domain-containing protein [Spartinivicinus sp. A2-2]
MVDGEVLSTAPGQLKLVGSVTFRAAATIEQQGRELLIKQAGNCTVDLSEVREAGSAALSVLLSWMRQAHHLSINLSIVNMPTDLYDLARVSGLDTVLPIQQA